jgi:hypothetical protein
MWQVPMTPNLEVIGPLPPGLRLGVGANNADIAILDIEGPRLIGPRALQGHKPVDMSGERALGRLVPSRVHRAGL